MDLTIILTYLSPMIVLGCLIVGWIIKNLVPSETVNKFIPITVTILGVFLSLWTGGWVLDLPVLLTGAISGLASTGLYELFDQFLKSLPNKTQ